MDKSLKQEWREKAEKFIDEYPRGADFLPVRMAEAIPDLGEHFYSLHLQEISKIREKIKETQSKYHGKDKKTGEETYSGGGQCRSCGKRRDALEIDDVLLALTDEK